MNARYLVCLSLGLVIGGIIVALLASQQEHFRFQAVTAKDSTAAWRLNTQTGLLEVCSAFGGKPTCYPMPAPGSSPAEAATAPAASGTNSN